MKLGEADARAANVKTSSADAMEKAHALRTNRRFMPALLLRRGGPVTRTDRPVSADHVVEEIDGRDGVDMLE